MFNIVKLKIKLKTSISLCFFLICFMSNKAEAFGLKNVFQNLHTNVTEPSNYQSAAAGYYSGGGVNVRTKNTAIQPFSMSAPSLSSGCNGIDAFAGSFSMISSGELVNIAQNIGNQAVVYGFHLGLKTYAPQIETTLKDLRNLQMELSQFGIANCKVTQAAFAAALPQNTAMYETVCNEMASQGGKDLGGQQKKCKTHQEQKKAIDKKQEKDPDALIDNYNIFTKVANSAGIPKELQDHLMSMVGTIIVKNGVIIPYPSLANDPRSWDIHINGGSGASMYSCSGDCLNITVNNNVTISAESSYSAVAKAKLDQIKEKIVSQTSELSNEDKGFLDSLGQSFPIFDHITLEASARVPILDSSSQLVARYMLMNHLTEVTKKIKNGVYSLKNRQLSENTLVEYEKSLTDLLKFANAEWVKVMNNADRVNARAKEIEKHLMARERS